MSEVNVDSLLDGNLDDLADLPEFKAFPNGAHRVTIKFEQKKIKDHPCIEMGMKLISTEEMSDPAETPLQPGAETSVLYMLDNEIGQGKFKDVIKQLQVSTGPMTNRETLAAAQGMEVLVTTKVRYSEDKTRSFTDVVKLLVL